MATASQVIRNGEIEAMLQLNDIGTHYPKIILQVIQSFILKYRDSLHLEMLVHENMHAFLCLLLQPSVNISNTNGDTIQNVVFPSVA